MDKKMFAYVGNYSKPNEGGISVCRYDPASGALELIETVRGDIMAGQLYLDTKRGVLYVVDERVNNPDLGGKGGGGRIFAFAIDPETGALTEISRRLTYCANPTFITPDRTGAYLLICSHSSDDCCTKVVKDSGGGYHMELVYSDSVVVLYPVEENGALGEPCDIRIFPTEGGVYSCMHSINASPDGSVFAVCERNQNKVHLMRLNYGQKRLELCSTAYFPCGTTYKNGHAPRYGAFHPTKELFYFNSEYKPCITTMRYTKDGGLETAAIQEAIPQLEGIDGSKFSLSDICVDKEGRYMYALYRIIDVVCAFKLDDETGLPEMAQSIRLKGAGPRGMRMSPDGRFILVADRDTKQIETLAVRPDGLLENTDLLAPGFDYPSVIVFNDN